MNEQPQENKSSIHYPWLVKIIKTLLFSVVALLIAATFERFGKIEHVEEMKSYQKEMTSTLNGFRPQRLYYLFAAAMGFETLEDWKQTEAYRDQIARCERVGDQASIASQAKCVKEITIPIGHWTESTSHWLSANSINKNSFVVLILLAVSPLIALADVVWHNFLEFSSFAIVHLFLLVMGLWGAFRLLKSWSKATIGFFGGLLNIALFPILTVAIASLIAEFLYYFAWGGVTLFGGALSLASTALTCTGGFFCVQLFYKSSLKVADSATTGKAEQIIEAALKRLFQKSA